MTAIPTYAIILIVVFGTIGLWQVSCVSAFMIIYCFARPYNDKFLHIQDQGPNLLTHSTLDSEDISTD